MSDPKLPSVMEILSTVTGRAMRADDKSHSHELTKEERWFHAGRREAYLQMIALICGTEVKNIRKGTLGASHNCKKLDDNIKHYPPVSSVWFPEDSL